MQQNEEFLRNAKVKFKTNPAKKKRKKKPINKKIVPPRKRR